MYQAQTKIPVDLIAHHSSTVADQSSALVNGNGQRLDIKDAADLSLGHGYLIPQCTSGN